MKNPSPNQKDTCFCFSLDWSHTLIGLNVMCGCLIYWYTYVSIWRELIFEFMADASPTHIDIS